MEVVFSGEKKKIPLFFLPDGYWDVQYALGIFEGREKITKVKRPGRWQGRYT